MNHLRSCMSTEQTDHQDTETVSQYAKRNNECHKYKAPPGCSQEQIRCEDTSYQKHPARPNSATFLRYFDLYVGQLEKEAATKKRHTAEMEKDICDLSRGIFRGRLQRVRHCVRHRNHENKIGERKRCYPHPLAPQKEKATGRETTKKRERQNS